MTPKNEIEVKKACYQLPSDPLVPDTSDISDSRLRTGCRGVVPIHDE